MLTASSACHSREGHTSLCVVCCCLLCLPPRLFVGAGDSRAVLSRGDVAIPLTDDHKAAREDETVSILLPLQGNSLIDCV